MKNALIQVINQFSGTHCNGGYSISNFFKLGIISAT
jgi:hypothetical protein